LIGGSVAILIEGSAPRGSSVKQISRVSRAVLRRIIDARRLRKSTPYLVPHFMQMIVCTFSDEPYGLPARN
jgi:hypothetical protein